MRKFLSAAVCFGIGVMLALAFFHFTAGFRDETAEQAAKCRALGMVLLTGRDFRPVCVDGVYP